MTNEEAIEYGTQWLKDEYLDAKDGAFIKMAVEALRQELCEDAISRKAAIDALKGNKEMIDAALDSLTLDYNTRRNQEQRRGQINEDIEAIKVLSPVTPRQKTGQWISMNTGKRVHLKDGMSTESVKCSECDEWLTASDEYACNGNYCPNCGAKMEEVTKEEEFDNLEGMLEDLWNATVEDHRKYSEDMESEDNECLE